MVIETILETKEKFKVNGMKEKGVIIEAIEAKSGLKYMENVSKKLTGKVLELGPLEEVFSGSESKILDFLVVFQEYDYSISDIATNSGIGFKTTLGIIKHLEEQQIIVNTRNVGRALMYRLNPDSKKAKKISSLALHIATSRLKENKKKN